MVIRSKEKGSEEEGDKTMKGDEGRGKGKKNVSRVFPTFSIPLCPLTPHHFQKPGSLILRWQCDYFHSVALRKKNKKRAKSESLVVLEHG